MKRAASLLLLLVFLGACGGSGSAPSGDEETAKKNLAKQEKMNAASRAKLQRAYDAVQSAFPYGNFPDKGAVVQAINDKTPIVAVEASLSNTYKALQDQKDAIVVFYAEGNDLEMGYAPYTAKGLWPLYLHSLSGDWAINTLAPSQSD